MNSHLRLRMATLFIAGVAAACSSQSKESTEALALLDEAAAAMGGWSAIDSVTAQEIRTSGTDWEPLQAITPEAEPRQTNSFEQTLLVDYRRKRMRLTFNASRTYPTPAPVNFVEVIDGDVGMLEATKERLHPSRLATRLRDYDRLPLRVLHSAKAAVDLKRIEGPTPPGNAMHVLRYIDRGVPVELNLDSGSKLPTRVIYMEDDPVYGDVPNEVLFSDWKDHSGLKLPATLTTRWRGKKIREEQVRSILNNPPIDDAHFEIPADVKAQPESGERIVSYWVLRRAVMGVAYQDFGREQKVEFFDVAPGIYHVRGGSHHSMAVEMKDHLVVVEAPLFDERSVAVIRALEERFPGKPVKYLVVTHFHFDHSGGVRAYVAKGSTVIAHDSILPFIQEMLLMLHTVRPDTLARMPVERSVLLSRIQGASDIDTLSDGERVLELRAIPNDHASGMLIAYLPREKVVFVSDLYSPPGSVPNPSVIFERERATAFYEALKNAGLAVETVVGGHGVVGPFSDLEKAVR